MAAVQDHTPPGNNRNQTYTHTYAHTPPDNNRTQTYTHTTVSTASAAYATASNNLLRPESPVSPLVSPLVADFDFPSKNGPLRLSTGHQDAHDMSPEPAMASPTMSPTPSISSFSNASAWHISANLAAVYPPPAYVAPFGATQVVSERKRHASDDDDDEDDEVEDEADDEVRTVTSNREDMQFSAPALLLVNGFLDQLLYSFLSNARSTTLTALRPAVRDVLKSRLAADAIASAEEELQELLAGGEEEEEEMNQRQSVAERNRTWDTELVWKRTRLRVMVYIRLGEMEDDDEERFVKETELFHNTDRRFSTSTGLVSWAAAIFLTSVLEYIAEQVLQAAGNAADVRARRQNKNLRASAMSAPGLVAPRSGEGLVVEDFDMEKVALNSTLGRLWRTWRKSLRNNSNTNGAPTTPPTAAGGRYFSRRMSRDVALEPSLSPRRHSFGAGPESLSAMDDSRRPSIFVNDRQTPVDQLDDVPEADYPEHVLAANIPLPISDIKRDIDEIEVPGLATDPDAAETDTTQPHAQLKRRNSLTGAAPLSFLNNILSKMGLSLPESRRVDGMVEQEQVERPTFARQRSHSAPIAASRQLKEFEDAVEEALVQQTTVEEQDLANVETDSQATPTQESEVKRLDPVDDSDLLVAEPALDQVPDQYEVVDRNMPKDLLEDAATGAVPDSTASTENPGKRDSRKSLPADLGIAEQDQFKYDVNMKRLSAAPIKVHRNFVQAVVEEPESGREHPASAVGNTPSSPAYSRDTFSLEDETPTQQVTIETRQMAPLNDGRVTVIGLAHTSDTAVSTPEEPPREYREARGSYANPTPRRQSRLILTDSPDEPSSPVSKEDSLIEAIPSRKTQQDFVDKRSASVSPKSSQLEQVRAEPKLQSKSAAGLSAYRASLPNSLAFTKGSPLPSPGLEKQPSPWRQSFSAATEKTTSWVSSPKKNTFAPEPAPAIPVQEHPVVQRMASMKRRESKAEEKYPLTSASIKGPEDFEMFVQGGDTVKYTLTPENVRDDPVCLEKEDIPLFEPANEKQSPAEAVPLPRTSKTLERTPSPPKQQSPPLPPLSDSRMGRSHVSKQATSATPIPPEPEEDEEERRARNRDKRRSVSRPPVRNTSVHRRSGLMAREPQVVTESTRDFADFIRSTGPTKEQEVQPILSSRASMHSLRQAHIQGSRSTSPGGRSLNRVPMKPEDVPPVPAMPKSRNGMQPREAKSNGETGTSDLIDFIRSGPSSTAEGQPVGQPRQHRISRTVAPFRTTMDSDQLQEWGDRIVAQPDLKLNTDVQSAPSIRSASSLKSSSHRTSANSRSALLPSGSSMSAVETSQPAYNGLPPRLSSLTSPKSAPVPAAEPPVRRPRNKDPYAIDLDDEDDDLLTALPRGRREEESLIDFLRSSGPTEQAAAAVAVAAANSNNQTQGATQAAIPPRRGSAPAISMKAHGADAVSNGMRRGSEAAVRTVNNSGGVSGTSKNGTTSFAVGPITKPRPKMEARAGSKLGESTTGDLADFLRTSGPDGRPAFARQLSRSSVPSKSEKKPGKKGFFSSGLFAKRPSAGRAYLDM